MAITEALRLVVSADTAGAVASVERLGGTADRELSRSERSLDRWGNRLTSVGAGMVAFGTAALAGLSVAVRSAADLEQAVGGTEAIFEDASGVIDRYAETAAESAGLSEQAFRVATTSIGGNLKRLGFDTDEAAAKSVELTQVAADLAATYGGTTAEAVQALGAAFRGEADPAERFNLDLRVSKVNAEAVALGLAESTDAVDDNAKAQALLSLVMKQSADAQGQFGRESDTLAGKQQILSAEFENLKASIGEGAMPVFQTFLGVASKSVDVFQSADDATSGLVGKIAAFGSVGLVAAGGLSVVVGQAIKMRENLGTLVSGGKSLIDMLGGVKGAAVGAAGAAGIGALIFAAKELEAANQAKVLDEMVEGFQAVDFAASEAAKTAIENADAIGILDELFERVQDSSSGAAHKLVDLIEQTDVGADTAKHYRDELEQHDEATKNATASQDDMTGAVGEGAAAMGESAEKTEDAKSALEEYSDELKGLVDPIFAAMDAVTGVRDAQLSYRDAQAEVLIAERELSEAKRKNGASSDEARDATRRLEDAQRALTDAEFGTVEAAADVDSALAALKDAVDRGDVSMDGFRSTLQSWVDQGVLTQEQANLAALSVGGLASQAEEADKQRVDIPVREDGGPRTRTELRAVRDAAFDIPRSRNTHVSASGVGVAIGALDNLARRLNALDNSSFHVSVGGGGGLTLHGGGFVPGPIGTEVAAVLQAGEFVVPLPEAQSLGRPAPFAAGAAPGATYVDRRQITIHTGADPQGVVEALRRYERSNGPIPVTVR